MILDGLSKLLESPRGTLVLLILICATVGLFIGKLEGMYWAAAVSTVAVIYNFVQHRVEIASLPSKGAI